MSTAVHASRLAIALTALLALAACSGQDGSHAAEGGTRSSSAGLPDGRIAIGEQLANAKGKATGQSCIDCHGPDGNVPIDATYPKLGGQYADYLARALQDYRKGDRDHALMTPQATGLSDQDIADLAAWFASRPSQLRDLHGVY
ncbi:cytochrome C biogenesis protein CcsA [Pseudoxanthomonas broegbernensis]|uniref:Cytochrome C biogenesis protein CcsA n=1 Tax=Pseudoxanthomonas broegbernensis TaxID=83619 RepID=A0A7V8GPT7_9GAMM|nr:cytochrome c [Pseudoxanthomonas broegbernensis]KAF1687938.1 cytochrome C biogenesis protein CcsA [Pseudoxanthomonas broegbernensis]MBB6064944.1 cytochrome c553 [Pseudoxanthomonas broegbernensis]